MMLTACVTQGANVARTLERPSDFPNDVVYLPYDNGRGPMWCLPDADYIRETQHIVSLNHVIDNYECQVEILNGAEKCDE